MFGLESAIELMFWAALAVQAVWIARLWSLCLTGKYKGLVCYLIVSTVWGLTATLFRHVFSYTRAEAPGVWSSYAWFYVLTRPVIWILFFVVLYECYDRMVDSYPGVRRAGQLTLRFAIGSAVALFIGLTIANLEQASHQKFWYRMITEHDESVYLGAAAAVLALVLFRRFFSLPLPKNVGLIFAVFGLYFVGTSAIYMAENFTLTNGFTTSLGFLGAALYLTCLTFGMVRFSPSGESVTVDFRSQGATASSSVAERQLRRINDQLTKALHV